MLINSNCQTKKINSPSTILDIRRANNPFRVISINAYCLLQHILKKLEKGNQGVVFISAQQLCEITTLCRRQNINLLREISNIVQSNYKRLVVIGRDEYIYGYTFSCTDLAKEWLNNEEKRQLLLYRDVEIHQEIHQEIDVEISKKPPRSINTHTNEDIDTSCIESIENNKSIDINYRSGNFSKISKELNKVKKTPKTKPTKNLKYFYPLSQEDCDKLQTTSKREFSLRAMNEILLDVSNRRTDLYFRDKEKFLSYMTKLFANEKRQTTDTNKLTFRIKNNISADEHESIRKSKFLGEFEKDAQGALTKEQRFKRGVAARFSEDLAYEFLTSYKSSEIDKNKIFKINMAKNVKLTPLQRDILLEVVRSAYEEISLSTGVYEGIEGVEIVEPSNKVIELPKNTNLKNDKNMTIQQTKKGKLLMLHEIIFNNFPAKKAYSFTHDIIYKEISPEKVLVYINKEVELSEDDKDKLRRFIRETWGENVAITTKRQMTEDTAVYVDTGQDNTSTSREPLWSKISRLLKKDIGDSSFRAWFESKFIDGVVEESDLVKIAADPFVIQYIHSNYEGAIRKALKDVKANILLTQTDGKTQFYDHESKFYDYGQYLKTKAKEDDDANIVGECQETV